jgi:hypothetical protein
MPLDSIEDYERLGEHLAAIDEPLLEFASARGYTVSRRGRYPNRRITQHGLVMRSIEIAMDVDEHGRRFDRFFPDIPYMVWGGAWVDDEPTQTRFNGPHLKIWKIPFPAMARHLTIYLEHFHFYLSGLTEDYIRAYGAPSRLAVPPSVSDL